MPLNSHAAKLTSRRGASVIFEATPDIIETRNVNYNSVDPAHMPGQIYTYKNTSSRAYNVSNIRLLSRTQSEAQQNLTWLWRLRGWTMPEFGSQTNAIRQWDWPEWDTANPDAENRARGSTSSVDIEQSRILDQHKEAVNNFGFNPLGAPPELLYFSAYSAGSAPSQHINRVPVFLQQLSIPYPSDVDYITTISGVPMPTIMTIDLTLVETHAPAEYESFSLSAFKQGKLGGF